MNAADFIASGILQDYCLGLLTGEKEKEVEQMCRAHPQVGEELNILRQALDQFGGTSETWCRAGLRRAVWEYLKNYGDDDGS